MGSPRRLQGVALSILLVFLGCGSIRTVHRTTTPDVRSIPRGSTWLKSHMKDGTVYVLSGWKLTHGDSLLEGSGQHLDTDRKVLASGTFQVPRDSAVLFESNEVRLSGATVLYSVLFVGTVVGIAACISNPKACYGSCPTFYIEGEARGPVHAEGFSASVAPFLEAADVDALYRVRPRGTTLQLRMTNEALETHVVRHADLLAVPRGRWERVAHDAEGRFYPIRNLEAPVHAWADEGDCASLLRSFDERERFSRADSTDLARKEVIELEFGGHSAGDRALLITARQTLLTTYLFYQTLAYLGSNAGDWFARLQRGTPLLRSRMDGVGRAMGKIEVWVQGSDSTWVLAGHAGETGPIAPDVFLVRLPATTSPSAPIQIRMTRGMWRLDCIALAETGDRLWAVRIAPDRVLQAGRENPDARAALIDSSRTLVTFPGDEYMIEYRLPERPDGYEYFLEARGYYLEWMREEWKTEQSPERLTQMFLEPEAALRRLAPDFKRIEPRIEEQFWGSRYVRR